MSTQVGEKTYKFTAGVLPLDFVNTVDWRLADEPVELLSDYGDLISWGRQAGAIDARMAGRLVRAVEKAPKAALAALRRAIVLREALFRIFSARIGGRSAEATDLELVNAALAEVLSMARLRAAGAGFEWSWAEDQPNLNRVVWPVVYSAADLLTSRDRLGRVGLCADPLCGWVFLDTSRNGQRRWCSMDDCGNRAKARRHYDRSKARQT
ncbi:MAG TPA: ABATE domain-containing protein [Bacillota bacterium]